MATESKKLQTIEGFTPGPWGVRQIGCDLRVYPEVVDVAHVAIINHRSFPAINLKDRADADLIAAAPDLYRLAHEQREVIRQLVNELENAGCVYHNGEGPCSHCVALAAAAPFLED